MMKDSMGRYRTNLFLEFNKTQHDKYPPIYTMREEEYQGLPSAYQIYMDADSEYDAAQQLVGSWAHWQRLLKCPPFMDGPEEGASWSGLKAWREEKELRDKATAYAQLKISAATGNVTAQKLIYEGAGGQKRGRPSKAEVAKAAAKQAEHDETVKNDLARLKVIG